MTKHLPLLISSIFIFQLSFSQTQTNLKDYPNLGIMQYTVITEDNRSEDDIYLNESFQTGKLITKENLELDAIKFRYSIKKDQVECRIGSQHSIINSPQEIKEININGTSFEYKKYLINKDTSEGYLLKLHGGDQAIYAKYYIPRSRAGKAKNNFFYLLKNKDGFPEKISSIRNLIANYCSNYEIQKYKKMNTVNWNNPMDLKKLFSYLSDLKPTK